MKSLLGTFHFNKEQCLNMNKIITGVFKHNSCTLVIDNRKMEDMFKYSIKPEHYARTSVPVPSTCTKRENQVPFKEKMEKA